MAAPRYSCMLCLFFTKYILKKNRKDSALYPAVAWSTRSQTCLESRRYYSSREYLSSLRSTSIILVSTTLRLYLQFYEVLVRDFQVVLPLMEKRPGPTVGRPAHPLRKFAYGTAVGSGLRIAFTLAGKGPVQWQDAARHGLFLGYVLQ